MKSIDLGNSEEKLSYLVEQGKLKEAIKIFKELISKKKSDYRLYFSLSDIYTKVGNRNEAIRNLEKVIELKPDFAQAHFNIGYQYQINNEIEKAIKSYKKATEFNPNFPEAFNNLGIAFKDKGKYAEAINSFREVIRLNPKFPAVFNNIGLIFHENKNYDYAVISYKKAIELSITFADAHFNLGNTYEKQNKLNNAVECYERAINLNPKFIEAYINLSISLKELGNLNKAADYLEKALDLEPKNSLALNNLSIIQLLMGDYQKGWKNYNVYGLDSKKEKYLLSKKHLPIPPWKGEKLKAGDKLLVICEHGLGDTLQFMRYIKYLQKEKIDVTFCPQENLRDLVKVSNIHSSPISKDEAKSLPLDKWTSILALPKFLKVSISKTIISETYIKTKPELINKWKSFLSNEEKPIIGINWQGNKENGYQIGRSFPLDLFSIILKRNKVKFISLQKGFGSEQLRSCSFKNKFVSCQNKIEKIWNFLEIAAIIENCNLIITSDTSIAHLAGGLGKETWLLLKYVPEWRWGLKDQRSLWYPSMRLFRQEKRGDWLELMERVSLELEHKIKDFEY